jgi:hypothetical protein
LAAEQNGFRKNYSTETAIFNLLNNILQALNDKKLVGCIFCDLTKAFDSVNHELLVTKMNFYGVQGTFFKLVSSYLNNRYQRVVIKDKLSTKCFSDWEQIRLGVPQGSILGLLFILLHVNGLPAVIKDILKPTLFADDINLILTASDSMQFKENLNIALGKIIRWFQANSLTLNFNKTYYMYFKTKMSQIDNSPIKYTNKQINSTHYIDLEVILDSTLSWQGHINKVITKLNSPCFAIRALKLF